MILQLSIKNFALIENAEIDFHKGFNVLYGETGSGKSILIDAIDYVLGGKFNKDIIRTGESKAYVEAVFTIDNDIVAGVLEELEIEHDDTICFSREMFTNGKSIIKINGKTSTISFVRKIAEKLIDIHGQHQNQLLFDRENYIPMVDSYDSSKIGPLLNEYYTYYDKLKETRERISTIVGNEDNDKLLAFIKFQIDEIDKAKLRVGEEEELNDKFKILSNAEKINRIVGNSYSVLSEAGDNSSVIDNIYSINRELSSIEGYSEKIAKINENILNIYYSLQEISSDLRVLSEDIVYDEAELETINDRLYKIANLKKKYGDSVEEVLTYKEKIEKQYNEITNAEKIVEELKREEKEIISKLNLLGDELHKLRVENSGKLEEDIHSNLKYIGLEKCKFKIDIIKEEIRHNGTDICEFLVSTNPGEPFKVMTKVASGGELSRIMLAIKAVFVDKDNVPTVVFDEIDTGISGRIAHCVGEKMYEIAVKHQVFCITHLPQIACFSDYHYLVKKSFKDEKTYSSVTNIGDNEKIAEIAKMLGGSEVLNSSLDNAKSMIDFANSRKIIMKDNFIKRTDE